MACSAFLINATTAFRALVKARLSAVLAEVRLCWSDSEEGRMLKKERCGDEAQADAQ